VSRTTHAGFVLDALELALYKRQPIRRSLVDHCDRGVQGGLKWLSRHLAGEGVGSVWVRAIVAPKRPAGGGPRTVGKDLGGHCDGLVE
jgi:hypothetical protein